MEKVYRYTPNYRVYKSLQKGMIQYSVINTLKLQYVNNIIYLKLRSIYLGDLKWFLAILF